MKIKNAVVAGMAVFALGNAQAELFDRGGGLIYDNVLNVTWLQDANYAKTSGYDIDQSDGRMNWSAANTWATNLTFHDAVRNVTYSDWRLPTALDQDGGGPCVGYNCTNSEMGHMFYNNMGAWAAGGILTGTNTANLALFANLKSDVYWSGTPYAPDPASTVWVFNTSGGYQTNLGPNGGEYYAWAVHRGDVAAPIPEPETYAMLLAGLGLLGLTARRRRQKLSA